MENKLIKYYKEKIGNIEQKKIDFSKNFLKQQIFTKKATINIQQLEKIKQKLLQKNLLKSLLLHLFIKSLYNINDNNDILLKEKIQKIWYTIKKLKNSLLEYKIFNSTKIFNIVTKKISPVFIKDANINKIKHNPRYKFQVPGYPNIISKFQKKLKKKLLIQRFRRQLKFILLQQNISLHTFIGNKEVSYANLVKENKLELLTFLYQNKIRIKTKKKTRFQEKQLTERPFKVAKMNQIRLNIMENSETILWYEKMKNQMLKI